MLASGLPTVWPPVYGSVTAPRDIVPIFEQIRNEVLAVSYKTAWH